ncbi:DUF6227 family protein [Streptomyces sp. LHD-70]|uniref:DUF6227 family protein n=1 Tax=Streptomyces sp. LHD-70 TaxID=3072140 RepID=UPI00280E9176|nr:DUF6227 family protein [Streptomyces sp. LHD-70]MDQ8706795.1 DUF6227 family protein [Streptomyces sp. LHD-70]
MSVPYETPKTPEEHLEGLLGRALNSFELPDETIALLESALTFDSSLRSAHHSAGLHRETHRHTFLLADGQALTLWELRHNTGPGGKRSEETVHELYADEEEAHIAASRLLPSGTCGPECPDSTEGRIPGCEPLALDTVRLIVSPAPLQRSYAPDDSADHARRLLRRAENADRPGADTASLLRTALAHQITQAFGNPCRTGTAGLCFALYEHAFLLADGREISLWEVEHTATPDGRHMCEVYVSETTARAAMERRASRTS